jgi:hypothetical protein
MGTVGTPSPASMRRCGASPALPRRREARIHARRGRRPGGSRRRRGEERTAASI